jgi:F-type H+-transporting ATPase subunit gamma
VAAENHRRLEQMEHALHRLEETVARLIIKRNALRQKELVKEIEVILSGEQASLTGARAM